MTWWEFVLSGFGGALFTAFVGWLIFIRTNAANRDLIRRQSLSQASTALAQSLDSLDMWIILYGKPPGSGSTKAADVLQGPDNVEESIIEASYWVKDANHFRDVLFEAYRQLMLGWPKADDPDVSPNLDAFEAYVAQMDQYRNEVVATVKKLPYVKEKHFYRALSKASQEASAKRAAQLNATG